MFTNFWHSSAPVPLHVSLGNLKWGTPCTKNWTWRNGIPRCSSQGATTSSKLGSNSLVYGITTLLQKKIRQFGAVGYIITLYSSKSYVKCWGSVQIRGSGPPDPQWLRPCAHFNHFNRRGQHVDTLTWTWCSRWYQWTWNGWTWNIQAAAVLTTWSCTTDGQRTRVSWKRTVVTSLRQLLHPVTES